jgi:hypothetical protein
MPFCVLSITGTRKVLYKQIQMSDNSENDALTFGSSEDSGKAYTAQIQGMHKHRRKRYIKICFLQHESEWPYRKSYKYSFVCHLKYPTIIKWLGWTVRVRIPAEKEIFFSPKQSTPVLWPIPPPNLLVPGFFPGCKAAGA